jgi:hypothetical protein
MKKYMLVLAAFLLFGVAPRYAACAQQPVPFVSGGIGIAEQEALKARESEFNLKLVFTLVEGNYIADVRVRVRDGKGAVLVDHVADGPFFLARLPAGRYTVGAAYRGKTETREVRIGARLRTEYLRWPSDPQTDFPLPAEKDR